MCANALPASASADGGGRQTQGKECRHGKANDTGREEAHRLPPPAGLDPSPNRKGDGTQQDHRHPRDHQPLGRVRQGLQVLEPHLRQLRRLLAAQGLRREPEQALPLHGRMPRGLQGLRGAHLRAPGRPVARLQRVRGLQVVPHGSASTSRKAPRRTARAFCTTPAPASTRTPTRSRG